MTKLDHPPPTRRGLGVACALAVTAAMDVGCSPDPTIQYAAYTGTAYPNRAAPITWPNGGAAVLTNSYSDTMSAIDLATGKAFFTRPIGRNPVDLDGPHHVVVDPKGAFAYTALSYPRVNATGPHAAHGSASIPGYVEKISLTDFSIVGDVRVEDNPGDIVMSADGSRLVVSHFDLDRATKNPTDINAARASIAIVDPSGIAPSGSPRPTFITTCVAPHGLALEPGTGRAFASCYGEDAIAIVDLDHPTNAVELVPIAADVSGFGSPKYGPYAAIFDHSAKRLAVSNTESKDVRFFDVTTKKFDDAAKLTLLGAPYFTAWSADDKVLYVPTQDPDALYRVPLDGTEATSVNFSATNCVKPHVVTVVGASLFLVCEGDHKTPGSLVVLDDQLAIQSSSPLGLYPDAFALVPAGGK